MSNQIPVDLVTPGFTTGHMRFRPGFGYGCNGVVFYDPELADLPVGVGTYMWDGAADTWFWVDPENDLFYVGMTQLLSYSAPALQEPTQTADGRRHPRPEVDCMTTATYPLGPFEPSDANPILRPQGCRLGVGQPL